MKRTRWSGYSNHGSVSTGIYYLTRNYAAVRFVRQSNRTPIFITPHVNEHRHKHHICTLRSLRIITGLQERRGARIAVSPPLSLSPPRSSNRPPLRFNLNVKWDWLDYGRVKADKCRGRDMKGGGYEGYDEGRQRLLNIVQAGTIRDCRRTVLALRPRLSLNPSYCWTGSIADTI